MRHSLLPVLACIAMFLQGCACSVKKDMITAVQEENLSLKTSLLQKEIDIREKDMEIALLKKDMDNKILLLQKDAAVRDILNEEKKKEMEKKIADLEAKSARSVSIDLFFKGNPYNYHEFPSEILDIWLKENKLPENPTETQIKAFAEKLPSVGRYFNNSNNRKLLAQVHNLPESFLKELIFADSQGTLHYIFEDAARRMDKETLKKYIQYSEGRPSQWVFTNRICQLLDKDDKEFIMKNFWNNHYLRKKAIEYGFYKELLPQIKEKVMADFQQYPELYSIFLAELTEEEKSSVMNRTWKQISKQNIFFNNHAVIQGLLENGFVPAFEQFGLIAPYIRNNSEVSLIEKYSPVGIGDLQDWIIKNKGNIVFDSKTGKFTADNKGERK